VKTGKAENVLEPQKCPWCDSVNSPAARYCRNCNTPLNSEEACQLSEKARERRELVEMFIRRLREEHPDVADGIFRELKEKMEALG
jgi:predicted amidophosphoribosyltransferase